MDVVDGLVSGRTVVLEHIVRGRTGGLHHRPAKPGQHPAQGRGRVVTEFVKLGNTFSGNDQRVSVAHRTDVEKGQHVVVLVHAMAWNLTVEDPIEDRGLAPGHALKCTDTLRPVIDLNALPLPRLFDELTSDGSLQRLVAAARREDLGESGDVSTWAMIDADRSVCAVGVARASCVVSGLAAIGPILGGFDCQADVELLAADGDAFDGPQDLWRLRGPLAPILGVERTLLNIIGRLCGIATLTARYVRAVSGTGAVVCDTRKTTPGLRSLEKYAVRCGGGTLHRLGLHDAVLFKDNHLAHLGPDELAAAVAKAVTAARARHDLRFVEVEVDELEQLRRLLDCPEGLIDIVLLDNMTPDTLREAVALRDERQPGLALEASGGITLDNVAAVAGSGVERVSIGALTHAVSSLDVSLEVR